MMKKTKLKKEKTKYNSGVTKEDLAALGKKGLSMDAADDRMLQDRKEDIDFTGNDLDVPGRQIKNKSGSKTLKDEENTLYGQGGDNKDNLEAPEQVNSSKTEK